MWFFEVIFRISYYALYLYMVCLALAGICGLFNANPTNNFVQLLNRVTDPTCNWVRDKYPQLVLHSEKGWKVDLSIAAVMIANSVVMFIIQKMALVFGIFI